jgi:hypothetical protein
MAGEGIPGERGHSVKRLELRPSFENLHGDPRFADMLRRLNLRE